MRLKAVKLRIVVSFGVITATDRSLSYTVPKGLGGEVISSLTCSLCPSLFTVSPSLTT